MNRLSAGIIFVLLAVIAAGAYKFIFQGSTSTAADGRAAIHLSASERDLVLTEMRTFLASVQQIAEGLSDNDMVLVGNAARIVGAAAQNAVPGTLVGKLPIQFKNLGFDTHGKFDQLAMDAGDLGDREHALSQLSVLMQNCVACHATYRIALPEEGSGSR